MAASAALAPLMGGVGAAGAASTGLGLFGSVLGGVATGWMKGMAEDRAEKRQIEEEKRREQRYQGLGQAVRFWETGEEEQQTPAEKIASQPALGKNPNMVGNKYMERAERNRTKMPKYRYDRRSGMIQTG